MASNDNTSALIGIPMARALECVTIEYCASQNKDGYYRTFAGEQEQCEAVSIA
jgi:hypothetical protein